MLILEERGIPRSKPNGVSVCGEVCHGLPFASQQIENATLQKRYYALSLANLHN